MRNTIAAVIMALMSITGTAMAQDMAAYPDKPLMLVISYGAGGATDYQARIVTMTAAEPDALGMPVALLNRPGEGGRVGWNWFATHAPPDGYALAAYNIPHFIAQSLLGGVAYDIDSFEPIANWGADPAVLVVPADSPLTTLEELLAFARGNPGALTVSGAGPHAGHHIAALQLEKAAAISLAFMPNPDGGAAAMKAVTRGEVMAGINNLSDAYRARDRGAVRVLGLFDLARHDYLPEVPTFREAGYDIDDASVNYRGIMVPKGTPQPIIDRLVAELPAMFADTEVRERMKAAGAPMRIMPRAQVLQMWQARQRRLRDLLDRL